jgi:fibronectin-binding autotransporter adhesin
MFKVSVPSFKRTRRQRAMLANAAVSLAALSVPILSQSRALGVLVWNNTTTSWEIPGAFSISGTPDSAAPAATDIVSFDPTVVPASLAVMEPTINSASDVAQTLDLADDFQGNPYSFTGAGTLTVGAGVLVRGIGNQTINGPILAGAAASGLAINIGNGAGLTLTGNTVASTNGGTITLSGTLILDDTTTTAGNRLSSSSLIYQNGGTLMLLGNASGSTENVGTLEASAANSGPTSGLTTIGVVVPAGSSAGTDLNFANTGTAFIRRGTDTAFDFVGVGGALGAAGGPRITFAAPLVTSTTTGVGMLVAAGTGNATTVGWATATDSTGTGWATYVAPSGNTGGIEILAPTATVSTAAGLQSLTAKSVADFTPASGSTTTLTATATTGSLRVNPGAGASLILGANLVNSAFMLIGSNDFTITGGSGTYTSATQGQMNFWVINPATTLSISATILPTPTGLATSFYGPGFVSLTGTADQFSTNSSEKIQFLGGTVRGNSTQLGGFGPTGGTAVLLFRGGVLEITGGNDGVAGSADFSRPVNSAQTAGSVDWYTTGTADTQGDGGGFSAFGSAASVDLGGSATPATLYWGNSSGSGFVQDGEPLIFGSSQSNARLDFLNPIALDSGTAGTYAEREIRVIGGAGGDETNFAGAISGSSSTDLIKTGNGTLVLSGTSTYFGNTDVSSGTLSITGSLSNSGTFNVNGSSNLILAAASAIPSTATVNVGVSANAYVNSAQTVAAVSSAGNATFTAGTSIVGQGNGNGTGAGGAATTGGINGTGVLSVNGTANLYASHITQSVLNIGSASTVTIADSAAPGNSSSVSILNDLNDSGTLDIKNNSMIVNDGAQFAQLQSVIATAYDGGKWDGRGLTSSSAAAQYSSATGTSAYGLAYETGAEIAAARAAAFGSTGSMSVDGQAVSSSAIAVKYTLVGDTTLTGQVGLSDLLTVQSNLDGSNTDWSQGNFHYGTGSNGTSLGDLLATQANLDGNATGNVTQAKAVRTSALSSNATRSLSLSPNVSYPIAGPTDLQLVVNTSTGNVSMVNKASTPTAFTAYNIKVLDGSSNVLLIGNPSDAIANEGGTGNPPNTGELVLADTHVGGENYNSSAAAYGSSPSLWALEVDGENTSGNGFGLAEAGASNITSPAARNPANTVTIPVGGSISLGNIFSTLAGISQTDLSFSWAPENSAGGDTTTTYTETADYISSTPEPGSVALLAVGSFGLLAKRRRRGASKDRGKSLVSPSFARRAVANKALI